MGAAPANVEVTVQPWPWQDPAAENVPEDLREAIRKQIGRDDRSIGHQGDVAFVDPSERPSDQRGPESPVLFLTIYQVPGGSYPYTTEGEDPDCYALTEALQAHGLSFTVSDEGSCDYAGTEVRWDGEKCVWLAERAVLSGDGEIALAAQTVRGWGEIANEELGRRVRAYFA